MLVRDEPSPLNELAVISPLPKFTDWFDNLVTICAEEETKVFPSIVSNLLSWSDDEANNSVSLDSADAEKVSNELTLLPIEPPPPSESSIVDIRESAELENAVNPVTESICT